MLLKKSPAFQEAGHTTCPFPHCCTSSPSKCSGALGISTVPTNFQTLFHSPSAATCPSQPASVRSYCFGGVGTLWGGRAGVTGQIPKVLTQISALSYRCEEGMGVFWIVLGLPGYCLTTRNHFGWCSCSSSLGPAYLCFLGNA